MQLSYRDAQGNIQLIRAGTALPANFAPHREHSNIGTGNGLNANGQVSPFVTNNPPTNYNMWIYNDVPKILVPRAVIPRWDMSFSATNASSHRIAVYYGAWNTSTSSWDSPIYTVCKFTRNTPFAGHNSGDWYLTSATIGTGNGQYLPSDTFNQFPVEVHPSVMDIVNASADRVLRFFMVLHNGHISENITGPWRAWFTLLCF